MKTISILLLSYLSFNSIAQVNINNNNSSSPAILELQSTNKGLLLPRTDPLNVSQPVEGLVLYNNTQKQVSVYNGAAWQGLAYGDMYTNFPNSIGYSGKLSTTVAFEEFSFVVPAGIQKLWIEAWAGGSSGFVIADGSLTSASTAGFPGGDAGDFGSFIMPVTPGETITIRVGRGGASSSTSVSGGNTTILTNISPIRQFQIGQQQQGIVYTLNSALQTSCPGLLMYIAGGDGIRSVINYVQSGTSEFRRMSTGGNGGDAYPHQKGGVGITVSYSMVDGTEMMGALISATGGSGAFPGAGGGVGFGNGGAGGAGLVIVHW